MTPDRYARIRARAASFLLAQKPRSFFALGLLDLRRARGDFLIDTLEAFAAQTGSALPVPLPDGMTLKPPRGRPLILYAAALPPHRRSFTLAHEIGHLLLSHTASSPGTEREADAFAAALLMPPAVIAAWEELTGKRMDETEMRRSFAVSRMAARRCRAELDGRGFGGFSEEERRLVAWLWRDSKAKKP